MFSDVERSTQLLQAVGPDVYSKMIEAHARIVRAAVRGCGEERGTEGDSFFVVFQSVVGALEAAVEIQRAIAGYGWPPGFDLRVRIGLHTGEAQGDVGSLVGVELNRAARIAATANGGQVVLSDAVVALIGGRVPSGVRVRDLGRHGLKDFSSRTHLYDLVIDGLPSEFPALRSLGSVLSNLPASRTRLVGRDEHATAVDAMLEVGSLVTLTGPGGVGKTRLALEVAAQRTGRPFEAVYFVDFSAVSDPSLVVAEVASAIKARATAADVVESVIAQLRERPTLLVLDNLEQIVEGSPDIGVLLDRASELAVLATSRVPLRLRGEVEYRVQPLALPADAADPSAVATSDAVELLITCAASAGEQLTVTESNVAAITDIVRLLDGLPLAVELAARQLRVLDPSQLAARLKDQPHSLTGGARDAAARHRGLEETIQWSVAHLDAAARAAFLRLSSFTGSWSLDAAQIVCGPDVDLVDVLATLVDHSLVTRTREAGELRFSMLTTIRTFAARQLSASPDDAATTQHRYITWCENLVTAAEPHLMDQEQATWLARLELEHNHLRSCLDHLERSASPPDIGRALNLCAGLWRFWQLRNHLQEGRDRTRRLLDASRNLRTAARVRALGALGSMDYWLSEHSAMEAAYREQLDIANELGDDDLIAEALYNASFLPMAAGNPAACLPPLRVALDATPAANLRLRAQISLSTAFSQFFAGDTHAAIEPAQHSLDFSRRIGDRMSACEALLAMAMIRSADGDAPAASQAIDEATQVALATTSPTLLAKVAIANALRACARSDHEQAAELLGASDRLRDDHQVHLPAVVLSFLTDATSQARTALGDQTYERAHEHGSRTTVSQLLGAH